MIKSAIRQPRISWADIKVSALFRLVGLGLLSVPVYMAVLVHGNFRSRRMEPFFIIFALAFVLYALGVWTVLLRLSSTQRPASAISHDVASGHRAALVIIFGFSILLNLILLPSWPSLSDDMFRYVWDGRVQAAGINPYRYPSNAPELIHLRDPRIWQSMNRKDAVTIYPPLAQVVFAATWRIFPDSVTGVKLIMIGATLLAGWLLVLLLKTLGLPPERVLIFLWSPLLIFEVAHAAHVDALYLPLLVGALLLRAGSLAHRVSWRHEVGIGILLGLATLVKLYPIMLAVPLWSVRDQEGKRRWRLALPAALLLTILAGYALYIQPGVDTLGFLTKYGKEFFNISPLMHLIINGAKTLGMAWYQPANIGMPLLAALVSLLFVVHPARDARQAIMRCVWLVGIYLLINHNLFAWYALWLLPLIAIDLRFSVRHNGSALAWWVFTGTIALSYTFFIRWQVESWAIWLEFVPLYVLLIGAGGIRIYHHLKRIDRSPQAVTNET